MSEVPPRQRVMGAIVAAAVLAAAGVWLARHQMPPRERLVVATVRQPATSLFFVAQAAGCLEAEGLDLDERTFDLGRDALVLLRDGRADVAIAYETPVLRASFADDRIRVLTSLHTSTSNTRLIARRGAIDDLSELRGRRVGAARGTNADFFVDAVLRFGGVSRRDVTVVDLAPEASVDALLDGRVDAVALSDPAAQRAERELGTEGRVITTDLYVEFSLLTTREDVLRSRPQAMEKLVRALACGARASGGRPEGSLALIRGRFPQESETDLRAQLARVRWGIGLDHLLLDVLRRERDWLRAEGHSSGAPPDLSRLVERWPLERVRPAAVLLPPLGFAP